MNEEARNDKKPQYVVVQKVKNFIKENDLRSNKEFLIALSDKVEGIVKSSIDKCKSEGKRKTLAPEDL